MSATDHDLAQPPDSERLASFPTRTLAAGTLLHRLHHRDLGPFWFGSAAPSYRGGGRFDLPTPNGSCYLALQPEAAFLETLGRRPVGAIPVELVARYRLTSTAVPRPLMAANVPVQRARAFGLTAEIHTTADRATTQAWAAALHAAGHRGVIAIPRHDVTARLRTVTLFDRGGEHPPYRWRWRATTTPVPDRLIDRMAGWGIRVLPIPFEMDTAVHQEGSGPS